MCSLDLSVDTTSNGEIVDSLTEAAREKQSWEQKRNLD